MAAMMEFKGTPPPDILERSKKRSKFFTDENEPIIRPNKKGRIRVPGCKIMREVIACDDDDFVDFVEVPSACFPRVCSYRNFLIALSRVGS